MERINEVLALFRIHLFLAFLAVLGLLPQAALSAGSPPTFGTDYISLNGDDFFPYYQGTYEHDGSATGRYPVTGTFFYTATVNLPKGVTVTEAECYVRNNIGSSGCYLYKGTPGTGVISLVDGASTAALSPSPQTIALTPIPAQTPNDPSEDRYFIGVTTTVNNPSNAQILGARIGYTGSMGTLISLPLSDRFVDTRPASLIGPFAGPFASGSFFDLTVTGVPGRDGNVIPVGAKAIVGNVTAVTPTANGLFKILPGGSLVTLGTSTVNFNSGFNTANAFVVKLNAAGQVRAYLNAPPGTSHLLIDVMGYYK